MSDVLNVPVPDNFGNYMLKSEGFSDIILPDAIALTPQTPGAQLLVAGLAMIIFWLAYRRWRKWRRNAYRRKAIRALSALSENETGLINTILKQAAMAAYPKHNIAGAYGAQWLDFLNTSVAQKDHVFTRSMLSRIEQYQYQDRDDIQVNTQLDQQCKNAAITWSKIHVAEEHL